VDDTDGMRRVAPTEEARRLALQSVPLGRLAIKDEIADLALFLCADAAVYITGAICVCESGQSLIGLRNFLAAAGSEPRSSPVSTRRVAWSRRGGLAV